MNWKNLTAEQRGMVKGGAAVGLLAGIGIAALCCYYEKAMDKLELDTAEFCIEETTKRYESILRKMKKQEKAAEAGDDPSGSHEADSAPCAGQTEGSLPPSALRASTSLIRGRQKSPLLSRQFLAALPLRNGSCMQCRRLVAEERVPR